MLIEFSVANYRSFRDRVTLSLHAEADDWLEPSRVTTTADGERLLRSVALYGLNSGGKTNLLRALGAMKLAMHRAEPDNADSRGLGADPFQFSGRTAGEPSQFEVVILLGGERYRYGFEITAKKVCSEWFFVQTSPRQEVPLFTRHRDHFEIAEAFAEGRGVVERTRDEVLFLNAVAGWNGKTSRTVQRWFRRLRAVVGTGGGDFLWGTAERLESDANLRAEISQLASTASLGFTELLIVREEQFSQVIGGPPGRRYTVPRVRTVHGTFHDVDGSGVEVPTLGAVAFDLERDESAGTSKFVSMAVPFLLALRQGSLLVVDELEARMHPALTRQLLDLFHGPLNTKGAQLIFATHDTHLLDPARIRRDQVYFVDKDERGASSLTRMSEYDTPEDADYERLYLLGLFGASPGAPDFTQALRNGRAE